MISFTYNDIISVGILKSSIYRDILKFLFPEIELYKWDFKCDVDISIHLNDEWNVVDTPGTCQRGT
jgi:hypothetical protein